jgi:hypothetical protein
LASTHERLPNGIPDDNIILFAPRSATTVAELDDLTDLEALTFRALLDSIEACGFKNKAGGTRAQRGAPRVASQRKTEKSPVARRG